MIIMLRSITLINVTVDYIINKNIFKKEDVCSNRILIIFYLISNLISQQYVH